MDNQSILTQVKSIGEAIRERKASIKELENEVRAIVSELGIDVSKPQRAKVKVAQADNSSVDVGALVAEIKKHKAEGIGPAKLCAILDLGELQFHRLVKEAVKQGLIVKQGHARGTKYKVAK